MSRKRTRITPVDLPAEGRTSKPGRRAAREHNRLACYTLGDGVVARMLDAGVILDEATGLDNMAADLRYGLPPEDLTDRIWEAIAEAAPRYTESVSHEFGPDGWVDIRYPMHVSVGVVPPRFSPIGHLVADAEVEPEPLGPSAGADDDVVETTVWADGYAVWDGDPWRDKATTRPPAPSYDIAEDPTIWYDPNEAAAVRAEAAERALDDDYEPGE